MNLPDIVLQRIYGAEQPGVPVRRIEARTASTQKPRRTGLIDVIIARVADNPGCTTRKLATLIGCPSGELASILTKLTAAGRVTRKGTCKGRKRYTYEANP